MSPEAKIEILAYCRDVLEPRAEELERVQYASIPWHPFRWRRANRAHRLTNETWKCLLDITRPSS